MKSNILQRLFLTLTLCLVGVIASWADSNTYTRDGIVYTLDETNSTASVTGYESGITTANIKARVGGCAVTSIERFAFYYCSSLTSVTIPSSVTSIGEYAFYSCSSLTSVSIPSSVTSIGEYAFCNCSSLTSISVSLDNKNYTSDGKALFNKGKTKLIMAVGRIKAYEIPSSVTSIESGAFQCCSSLTSVTIPSSVTNIGEGAFCRCSSLTYVIIPSSVTNIGLSAFKECSSALIKVLSPKIYLGPTAFAECKNVILNSSNIDFEFSAFYLTSVFLQPCSQNFSITTDHDWSVGDWFSAKDVYNTAKNKGYTFISSYRVLPSGAIEIVNKYEDILSFISQKKNIYNVIDSNLRSNLDNLLDQISDFAGLASKEDSELATMKTNLTTAFNDVRNAIYDQIDLNYDLSDVYKQAESIASDERIAENKAFGFPYADFNDAFSQAKKELDGVCATQNTIDRLQDVVDVINSATKVDFAKSEYLTLYSNKALVVPEGMKAAVVVAKGDDIRNDYRYASGATVPARTGVLLKGENGYLGYLLEGASTETAPTDNLLHGTLNDEMTNVEGAGKYYKLSFDRETTSVIGFYWGATDGAAFINKAGKAFLAIPATLNAQQLRGFSLIDMDKTDAITGINGNTISANAPLNVFDMNGRRVEAKSIDDLQPGIYVVNGKKIIK